MNLQQSTTNLLEAPSVAGLERLSGHLPALVTDRHRARTSIGEIATSRAAQQAWAATPLKTRLGVLRAARHRIAAQAESFAAAISPALQRSTADTLVAEVLPLLDACRFLEREASRVLSPEKFGRRGRPFWLAGVFAEIHREPLGRVLIIGPGNFPLFLPGVQTLQALAAGNSVIWKPGVGGEPVAELFARVLDEAGLPSGVLHVTGEAVEDATGMIDSAPDKVVFTGASPTGREILKQLAPKLIPAVLELSGTDAVIVLRSADMQRAAKAVAFGLRLNGGQVCMSPRRVIGTGETLALLRPHLVTELEAIPPVALSASTAERLEAAIDAARLGGARLEGEFSPRAQRPILLHQAYPDMSVTHDAFFAPVLSLLEAEAETAIPALHNQTPFALTCSIFGEEAAARTLVSKLRAGSVLINDLIAPTADPRLPFGGRGESGYGVTRGAEGLLAMTVPKVVQVRRNHSTRHYAAASEAQASLFAGVIRASHAAGWRARLRAVGDVVRSARNRRTS